MRARLHSLVMRGLAALRSGRGALQAALGELQAGLGAVWRRRGAGDVLLARWVSLSIGVLAALVALQACRLFMPLNEWQLRVLAGDPFYLSAADAQVSLLSPGGTFGVCVCVTLYMGAALLRMPSLAARSHLCVLAAVAVALPGFMCVLWHGVLYVAQPFVCVLLLWLAVVPCTAVRRRFFL